MTTITLPRLPPTWRTHLLDTTLRASGVVEELVRVFAMACILGVAARALPRRAAMATADAVALVLLALPRPGAEVYWELRNAFGRDRACTLKLACGWLARPLRDHVALHRVASGRQDPAELRIVEHGASRIERLRRSGASFVLATIHGSREAFVATRNPDVVPGAIVQVGLDPSPRIRCLHDLRIRLQYGALVGALSRGGSRPVEFVAVGVDPLPARTLLTRLQQEGRVVMMDIDAPRGRYETGSFERPFAGLAGRSFSTGAAQLAKKTGRPLVGCATRVSPDGTVELFWAGPIEHVDDPRATMDRLLDAFEICIGEDPTQYVRRIGSQRRFDPARRRWIDRGPRPQSANSAPAPASNSRSTERWQRASSSQ